jgi:hypothetical protein
MTAVRPPARPAGGRAARRAPRLEARQRPGRSVRIQSSNSTGVSNLARMPVGGSQRSQERGSYSRHITGCRPRTAQRVSKWSDQRSGRST